MTETKTPDGETGDSCAASHYPYRENAKVRHIICFLKHGGERLHAIWLAKTMGGFADFAEARKWVEELSHPEPVSIAGWMNRDNRKENSGIIPQNEA